MPFAARAHRVLALRRRLALLGGWVIAALCAGCLPPLPDGPASGPAGPTEPVDLIVEPEAGPAPVLELLGSARQSLWMEMYLLTSGEAIAAIEGRARAGCDVRVTLEPSPYQDDGANQAAFDRLAAAGATVRWSAPRFSFTHAKAFTIDHQRLVAMTLNLTEAGLATNRELAVGDDAAADVSAAEAVFLADQTGAAAGAAGRLVTSPDASRGTLMRLIEGASRRLSVETEELTDPGIAGGLAAARARGVTVTVVLPGPTANGGPAVMGLARAGVDVRAVEAPTIHAKALVADGTTLYVGSANLSSTSLDENREIGVVATDRSAAAEVEATIAADAARGAAVQPL